MSERLYIIPKSCWRPRFGTGIPADEQMYPPGCPDPEWCRGSCCYWGCKYSDDEWEMKHGNQDPRQSG